MSRLIRDGPTAGQGGHCPPPTKNNSNKKKRLVPPPKKKQTNILNFRPNSPQIK